MITYLTLTQLHVYLPQLSSPIYFFLQIDFPYWANLYLCRALKVTLWKWGLCCADAAYNYKWTIPFYIRYISLDNIFAAAAVILPLLVIIYLPCPPHLSTVCLLCSYSLNYHRIYHHRLYWSFIFFKLSSNISSWIVF